MSIPTEPAAQKQGILRWSGVHEPIAAAIAIPVAASVSKPTLDLLQPLRSWLDRVHIRNAQQAHQLCRLIPSQCPFERDVKVFGRTLLHIPPLCKLNPLYDELVALRFRALCYLADECGEDISAYC